MILPTYNRKSCIARMVDSVLQQSFKNFELIIIDDGSTDGTFEMLKEKYKDKRVRLLRQENGGVSSARNLGISLAKGEYVTFVDSDDYLLNGFFWDAYYTLQRPQPYKPDLLVYPNIVLTSEKIIYADFFLTNSSLEYTSTLLYKQEDFLKAFCLMFGNPQACAKFFKRKIINHFRKHISYGEDLAFVISFLLKSSYIQVKNQQYYVYVVLNSGLSRGELSINKKIDGLLLGFLSLKCSFNQTKRLIAYNYIKHLRFYILKIDRKTIKKEQVLTIKTICELARRVAPSTVDYLEIFLLEKSLESVIIRYLLAYIYKKYPKAHKLQSVFRKIRNFL
ncbi:hypothetical protein CQA62_06075 [Helicobacter cholecystus]|uniref:Glycosyltransferase 2-like domain-containing protein n=1 Tax=Helicobacter cholecystus TaxID=45498 RepID=A0A3D8ITN7_9HELI|nr:hypothetical protein CQA62_06075 [Helicobacter cholecystus]